MDDHTRLREALAHTEFFAELPAEERDALLSAMRRVRYRAGDIICREGDPANRMFLVGSGEVHVVKTGEGGRPVTITSLAAGEVLGMMSLFEKETRSATLVAATDTVLWEIEHGAFQARLEACPALARGLLAVLSRHLRRETGALASLRSVQEDRRLRIAVFDSKPYTEHTLRKYCPDTFALRFFEARLSPDTVAVAAGYKVICAFVNDRLDAAVVAELRHLGVEMIALRCAGYNNVDLDACHRHGISVARVPAYSPHAVAEHAVALMMGLNRHIHRAHNRVREGNFSLNGLVGFDMHGKTVGIVGTGRIGACLVEIMLGFGCRVLGYDIQPNPELAQRPGCRYADLPELFSQSDIISLHAPLTPQTHHLIDAGAIAAMKPGVMIINTSRGGLIDTQALVDALVDGHVGSAGLDVYEEESEYFFEDFSDSIIRDEVLARLTTFNNVMITSHMAFLTQEALANIAETTFGNIGEFAAGKRGRELSNGICPKCTTA